MIDKWFTQEIDNILKEKDRIVISAQDENAGFFYDLIPAKYKIFKTGNEIEELKAKYETEKNFADKKVVIFTRTPREKLRFIREYCETCGCIDIKYLHNYVKEKVYASLKTNLQLTPDEIATAAKISTGKTTDYWLDIIHKGSHKIIDMDHEIHPFLNDPEAYCKKLDEQVEKEFFARLNKWIGRDNIDQPPVTAAKEAAKKILGSLVSQDRKKKFKEAYKKWADSKKYENSLELYLAETQLPFDSSDIWAADVSHPFAEIDRKWLADISEHLSDKPFIKEKLGIIRKRAADKIGKKTYPTLWQDITALLEFDPAQINTLNTFEETLRFYTEQFYKLDTAVRRLYSDFLNEKEIIQPFQEYYKDILIRFLDKWYANFRDCHENQTGLIKEFISETQEKKSAIIIGDGISYEISKIVSEKLKDRYETDCSYRLAGFPSTTEINMSRIYIDSGKTEPVQKKREQFLRNKYKEEIRFMLLDEVNYSTETAQYLICTYKDIDDIAEKKQQNALKYISQMENELAEKTDQLLRCGYKKVCLTSDHGFVLTGILSESDKIEFDFTGKTEKNERYVRTAEKQKISEQFVEVENKWQEFNYVYFHKSNNPFKTPGMYGYSHGGISPQELVVPYLCVEQKSQGLAKPDVTISNKDDLKQVPGDIFEISLQAGPGADDLFSMNRKIVILFMDQGKQANKSDIITLNSDEVLKKEYSFDRRSELEAVVIDAETKETLDMTLIKQKIVRDTGGLL